MSRATSGRPFITRGSSPLVVPDMAYNTDPALGAMIGGGLSAGTGTTLLMPTFQRIDPQGLKQLTLSQIGCRVTTGTAASSFGAAIYAMTWTDPTHWSGALVCQLNAAASGVTAGLVFGDVTTGAAGSGTAACPLDFVNFQYAIGQMVSTVTTLALVGLTASAACVNYGLLQYSGSARSSVTDWPATIDQTSTAAIGTARIQSTWLKTAAGKQLP